MFRRPNAPVRFKPVWVQQQNLLESVVPKAEVVVGTTTWYLVMGNETAGVIHSAPAELLRHPTYLQLLL